MIRDHPPKGKGKRKAPDPSPSPTSPSSSLLSIPISTPTSPPVTRDSLSALLEKWLSIHEPVAHVSFARELANYMQDELLSGKLNTEMEEVVTTVLAKVVSYMGERQDNLDRAASFSGPGSSNISVPSTKVRDIQSARVLVASLADPWYVRRKLGVQKSLPIPL